MEVKEIFLLLSEGEPSTFGKSFLFETIKERNAIVVACASGVLYVFFMGIGFEGTALVFALFSILSFLYHSAISVIRDKEFFSYPVKGYVEKVNERCDIEIEVLDKLSKFSEGALIDARDILIYEQSRVERNILFLSGSIYKVGVFPSFLAFFYAFHSYQSSPDSGVFAYVLLGVIVGMYVGVMLIQRITSWQSGCIYLLNKLTNEKE